MTALPDSVLRRSRGRSPKPHLCCFHDRLNNVTVPGRVRVLPRGSSPVENFLHRFLGVTVVAAGASSLNECAGFRLASESQRTLRSLSAGAHLSSAPLPTEWDLANARLGLDGGSGI